MKEKTETILMYVIGLAIMLISVIAYKITPKPVQLVDTIIPVITSISFVMGGGVIYITWRAGKE